MKRSDRAKKEKKNQAFIVFILVIVLVSSIAGFVVNFGNNTDPSTVTLELPNGKYKFKQMADSQGNPYYTVTSKNIEFTSFYLPQQINLKPDKNLESVLGNSPYFYLSIDPNSENMQVMDYLRYDIKQNMPESKFFLEGVSEASKLYPLPVVNCNNATSVPVIILRNTNTTNITTSGNCLDINFQRQNTMQVRDMIVYIMQGIPLGDTNGQ